MDATHYKQAAQQFSERQTASIPTFKSANEYASITIESSSSGTEIVAVVDR